MTLLGEGSRLEGFLLVLKDNEKAVCTIHCIQPRVSLSGFLFVFLMALCFYVYGCSVLQSSVFLVRFINI